MTIYKLDVTHNPLIEKYLAVGEEVWVVNGKAGRRIIIMSSEVDGKEAWAKQEYLRKFKPKRWDMLK